MKGEILNEMSGKTHERKNHENQKENRSKYIVKHISEGKISPVNKVAKKLLPKTREDHHSSEIPKPLKDFTVQAIENDLLMDYKNDPVEKKKAKPIAHHKAEEIEKGKALKSLRTKMKISCRRRGKRR